MKYLTALQAPICFLACAGTLLAAPVSAELPGAKFLITSVRTGDTEIFAVTPETGDAINLTRSPASEDRYPSWSPDGKQIVFAHKVGEALELFIVGADGADLRQLTHLEKIATPPAWSPNGKWISLRLTDERYWSDKKRVEEIYAQRPADKRPVWVIRPDGTDAHVIECLRFQCAMDGSRAAWKP